jgi:hypothetical protein
VLEDQKQIQDRRESETIKKQLIIDNPMDTINTYHLTQLVMHILNHKLILSLLPRMDRGNAKYLQAFVRNKKSYTIFQVM